MILCFPVHVTMGISCGICRLSIPLLADFVPGFNRIPEPGLPSGWRMVDKLLVCPLHMVTIENTDASRSLVIR